MKHIISLFSTRKNIFSRRNIVIALLFALGIALFLSIYDGVQEKEDLATLDAPLLAWTLTSYDPTLAAILRVITDISAPLSLMAITLIGAAIWAWKKRDYWRPFLLVGAMGLAYISSGIIKTFTARDRPTVTDLLESHASISYSFPSGHTIGIAVLLFVVGYFFCAAKPTLRRVLIWALGAFIGVTLVAFSRIYLGYHWLTDVSASVGLAFVILAIVILIDTYVPWYRRRRATSEAA
ncbi:MAG TPA: phosphatase PAP2 family protein [Candidatus Saccharimonadales bacterium]|jgi:undecaprenyl-diphosphatase|nr:phosphatase PAP2 family protein [Candidatus Saccharimonadales bacterium]